MSREKAKIELDISGQERRPWRNEMISATQEGLKVVREVSKW